MSRSSGHPAVGVQSDNGAEAHLRPILETQPVVLLRLAKDGVFLAVNESGLAALGAERLDQLLGSSIAALLPAEERASLTAFLERVVNGHRGSIEVDLTALTGTRHTMQVHAAPHPGAPDGTASVLATLRDVTEARRLEQSLVDAMQRQSEQEAAHEAERSRLISQLEEARQGQTTGAEYATQLADLERRLQEADAQRVEMTRHHGAEMEGLTEALEERSRIIEEQAARLTSAASSESKVSEALADASGRLKAAEMEAEAVREEFERLQESAGATELEREKLQTLLNDVRAEANRAALASEQAGSQTTAALRDVEQARQELEQARQVALQAQQDAEQARQLAAQAQHDAEQARQLAAQSQQELEQARQASMEAQQAASLAQAQVNETTQQAELRAPGIAAGAAARTSGAAGTGSDGRATPALASRGRIADGGRHYGAPHRPRRGHGGTGPAGGHDFVARGNGPQLRLSRRRPRAGPRGVAAVRQRDDRRP